MYIDLAVLAADVLLHGVPEAYTGFIARLSRSEVWLELQLVLCC